jgi:hypothetical protein
MRDPADEPLDELLRRWAERRAPTEGQITALRDRVRSALAEAPPADVPSRRPLGDFSVAKRTGWFFLGAAAAGVVAVLLWPEPIPGPRPDSSGTVRVPRERQDSIPALATLSKDQLAAKAAVWKEMERMFSGQLQWAAESDDKVTMGLLPLARPVSRGGAPVAIRLVVVSRKRDSPAWTPLWTVDVVTRGEEVVTLTREFCGVGRLLLWTYPMPDGMVAVDGRIALADRTPVDLSFSGIQRGGTTKAVSSADSGEVEYRVFQTVATVNEKTG